MASVPNTRRASRLNTISGRDRLGLVTASRLRAAMFPQEKKVTTINFAALTANDLRGKYIRVGSPRGMRHIWFDYAGANDNPGGGVRQIPITLPNYGPYLDVEETPLVISHAPNVAGDTELRAINEFDTNIYNIVAGARTAPNSGTSGIPISVIQAGEARVNTSIDFVGLTAADFNGKFFTLTGDGVSGEVYLYLYPEYSGVTLPTPTVIYENYLPLSFPVVGAGANATALAISLTTVINASGIFTATRTGSKVTIITVVDSWSNNTMSFCRDSIDDATGATFVEPTDGRQIVSADYTALSAAQVAALPGKYFVIYTASGAVRLYFVLADPGINSEGYKVTFSASGVTGSDLAQEFCEAMDASGLFVSSHRAAVVTLTDVCPGHRDVSDAGTTGATVTDATIITSEPFNWPTIKGSDIDAYLKASGDPAANKTYLERTGATGRVACWFTGDLTAIPATRGGSSVAKGILISPRHVLNAYHVVGIATGQTLEFVDSSNAVVTRTVSAATRIGTTDMIIQKLSSDVTALIRFAKILPHPLPSHLFRDFRRFPPCIMALGDDSIQVCDWSKEGQGVTETQFAASTDVRRALVGHTLQVGDSGCPLCMSINGELVVITTAHTLTGGPYVSFYATDINATMIAQGGGYKLTEIDLSAFGDIS